MALDPELSLFVIMAPGPALELCSFITRPRFRSCVLSKHGSGSRCVFFIRGLRLQLRSGTSCGLSKHFKNFGMPSVLLVANEQIIPQDFN